MRARRCWPWRARRLRLRLQAPWPYGQKEITVRAGPQNASQTIRPDRDGWRRPAALPITVVVGSADTEPQPVRRAPRGHDPRRLRAAVGRRDDTVNTDTCAGTRTRLCQPDQASRDCSMRWLPIQLGSSGARMASGLSNTPLERTGCAGRSAPSRSTHKVESQRVGRGGPRNSP